MLHIKLQAAESGSSGKEDFKEQFTIEPNPTAACFLDPRAAT